MHHLFLNFPCCEINKAHSLHKSLVVTSCSIHLSIIHHWYPILEPVWTSVVCRWGTPITSPHSPSSSQGWHIETNNHIHIYSHFLYWQVLGLCKEACVAEENPCTNKVNIPTRTRKKPREGIEPACCMPPPPYVHIQYWQCSWFPISLLTGTLRLSQHYIPKLKGKNRHETFFILSFYFIFSPRFSIKNKEAGLKWILLNAT